MSLARLLPRSRGEAMHNFTKNFPAGTLQHEALSLIPQNAVAAWVHENRACLSRIPWGCHAQLGPKATLTVILEGPAFFSQKWRCLFIKEVVAKSRLFCKLSCDLLRLVVSLSEKT